MWQHWHQAGCLVPGAWDRARSGCVCPLTAVSPRPSCTNQECRPCPLPPFTPQPTASAFCFHTAPSYPATPSFPAQLSFSGVWIVLTGSIYSSPSVACIPSHPSVVIVLTKATRTSWVHLVATSYLTSPRLHAGAQAPDHPSSASPLPLWLLHLTTFTGFSSSIGPLMFLFLRALSWPPFLLRPHPFQASSSVTTSLSFRTTTIPSASAPSLAFPWSSQGWHFLCLRSTSYSACPK